MKGHLNEHQPWEVTALFDGKRHTALVTGRTYEVARIKAAYRMGCTVAHVLSVTQLGGSHG